MPVLQRRIGLRDIRALRPGEIIWDGAVGGFRARRQHSKTVSYIVVYRTAEGRQRWQTIGRHGSPWTPDTAREAAKRILGHVVEGADPAAERRAKRKAASIAELCDLYLADAEAGRLLTRRKAGKKASTSQPPADAGNQEPGDGKVAGFIRIESGKRGGRTNKYFLTWPAD